MGTEQTRRNKIEKVRNILLKHKKTGIPKKKLIAILMMDGCSYRNVCEIIKSFIDLEEASESIKDGEEFIIYE